MPVVRFRIRRDTAANWTSVNPVLGLGEPGLETDTRKVKYGDGATAWTSLAYSAAGAIAWTDITGKPTTYAGYGLTAAALTKTDDTNVTMTLGGSPSTALIAATSITLGWSGTLAVARGGTGASTATAARGALGIGNIALQGDTGLVLTDATLPRYSLVRSGVGTWHIGNQTVGGTTNTIQISWNSTSVLELTTANAATFRGTLSIAGHGTTASGANAFIDSTTGLLSRSTSSLAYKRDVEDLDPALADALLALTPIWYRSAIDSDRQDWSWIGVSAEELAAIEPRLVHWGYLPEDYDQRFKGRRVLRKGVQLRPLGVDYARMTVPLLSIVQRLAARIDALEQEIAGLKQD